MLTFLTLRAFFCCLGGGCRQEDCPGRGDRSAGESAGAPGLPGEATSAGGGARRSDPGSAEPAAVVRAAAV